MSLLSLLAAVAVQSAVTNGVEVRWFEDMMPAKDGVKLYTYGAVPKEGVRCPVVIERNPYVKERRIDGPAFARGQAGALKRGYAYVVQHVRGAGVSEGKRVPYEHEREDGLALLEYVRKLPWYNGEIYLAGGSYLSTVHWTYLDTNPPDVKGAFLAIQEVDRYNVCYRNGFFKTALHGGWFIKEFWKTDHELTRNRDVKFSDFPLIDFATRYWGRPEPSFDNVVRHPRPDDPFWKSSEIGSGIDCRFALLKSTMPVLLKTGFYDIYTEGICDMWRETPAARRANCALLIDAYDHGGRLSAEMKGTLGEFPGGARADERVEALDWFDAIRAGRACPGAAANRTRYYALWENAWHEADALTDGPRRIAFRLGEGERSYAYDPKRPLPEFPGSGGICFGGMRFQPEPDFRDDVLSFVLPPLAERLDVRGRMTAKLTVASDCEDTCFYVRVSVKKPDGKWYLLRDDITSLSFQLGDYAPGSKRVLAFRFADHAFRLERGDVLRVDVASASSQFAPHANVKGDQFAVRGPKVAHNRVFAAESELVLYVNDGGLSAVTYVDMANPGFDAIEGDVARGWSKAGPAWRAEKGAGVNGSGGFVYETTSAQHAPRPTQKVVLKPGHKYRISAQVIADGLKVDRPGSPAQGMTVLLSWHAADGKWLGECVATPAAKGRTAEWQTASGVTPDIPAAAAYATVQPYVCGQGIGKGRIDNIVLEQLQMKVVETVVSSAYRNEATDGTVRFGATINWPDEFPAAEQKAFFAYVGRDGRPVEVEGEKVPCGAVAELDVGLFAEGTNDVVCLVRAGGKTIGSAKTPFARVRELPRRRAYIDAKKRLIVDGKPFFPLGLYTGRMTPETVVAYARSPFNCVGPYGTYDKEMLDVYERHGLKVIYSLCYAPEREASYFPMLRKKVTSFAKDHPAVIGWYICDEPTLGRIPGLLAWRREIEEMDGGDHPIWGCLAQVGDTRHFTGVFDVPGIDPYPVPSTSVKRVTDFSRRAVEGMFGTKAMWNIPQTFAWGWLGRRENRGQRAPTKLEMANMFWQMIAGGANGLVGYSYSQISDRNEDPDDKAAPYFAKVCAAAAEVRAYERVLLADGEPPRLSASDGRLACRAWREADGRTYVLAVNATERPLKATVSLSESFSKIVNPEFGPSPSLDGSRLSYDLPALGYVMARLVK